MPLLRLLDPELRGTLFLQNCKMGHFIICTHSRTLFGGCRYSSAVSLTLVLDGRWSMPQLLYLRTTDQVPMSQKEEWASGSDWMGMENIQPPTGFEPWTVQYTASCFTDYTIPAGTQSITHPLLISKVLF